MLVALTMSAAQFRRGRCFGTPVVTIERPPALGGPLQINASTPTRFNGTASLSVRLKCESKDKRLYNFSDEDPDTTLLELDFPLAESEPVTKGGEITGSVELILPAQLPPSTPVDSKEKTHVVWSLILTARANLDRKAETEYILSVEN